MKNHNKNCSNDECLECCATQLRPCQECCMHLEHDHFICLECEKDLTDMYVMQADDMLDCARDELALKSLGED